MSYIWPHCYAALLHPLPTCYSLLAAGLLTAGLLTAGLDEPRPQLCIDEDVEAEELEGVGLVWDGVMHLQRAASSE